MTGGGGAGRDEVRKRLDVAEWDELGRVVDEERQRKGLGWWSDPCSFNYFPVFFLHFNGRIYGTFLAQLGYGGDVTLYSRLYPLIQFHPAS